jgi:hypothetical protein
VPSPKTDKRKLSDRYLQSLSRSGGKPCDIRDTEVRGLRVRVTGSGLTFVLLARYGRGARPTRRAWHISAPTLAVARNKAAEDYILYVHWQKPYLFVVPL